MTSDPNDSSSDLEKARSLSRRLSGCKAVAAREKPAAPAGFIRFPSAAPAAPRLAPPPVSLQPPRLEATGSRRWDRLAWWLCEASQADAAILMDPHALLMAAVGALRLVEEESLGARMMAALDQAALMIPADGPPPVLCIALAEVHLTGFALKTRDGEVLTVGLVAKAPVPAAHCLLLRSLSERIL